MENFSIYLILPLGLGLLYSLAAMAYKRAMADGVDIWRLIFFSNLATAIILIPLMVLIERPQAQAALYQPFLAGGAFFGGIVLNILALQKGDVSVATPLLGTKVLFVALFTIAVINEPVRPSLWLAAILVVLGLKMLHGGGAGRTQRWFWPTALLAMGSSSAFALCDIFFQSWARHWGIGLFIPLVFAVVCTLSIGLLHWFPARRQPFSASARWWILLACTLNAFQTLGMFVCISLFRHANAATAINIVYNSRGIWSVLLVWLVGPWFGNIEREHGRRTMIARLTGSALLLSAIVLTLLKI
jgi:drug/metabolite transporter (DMT)-like permease